MGSARLSAILAGLFVLGALPLLFLRPAGSAGAGLSAGFLHPLESGLHITLFICVGLWAVRLGREASSMLPLSFVLMLVIGLTSEVGIAQFPYGRMVIFAAVMLFAMVVSLGYTRAFLISVAISSAVAFYLGVRYAAYFPSIASAGYYLLGVCISVLLVIAAGMSLAMTLRGHMPPLLGRFRKIPAVAAFLSFF